MNAHLHCPTASCVAPDHTWLSDLVWLTHPSGVPQPWVQILASLSNGET